MAQYICDKYDDSEMTQDQVALALKIKSVLTIWESEGSLQCTSQDGWEEILHRLLKTLRQESKEKEDLRRTFTESRAAEQETEEAEAAKVEASYYTPRPEVEAVDDVTRNHPSQPLTGPAAKDRQDEPSLMIIQVPVEVSKRGEKRVNPDISGKNLSLCMLNLLTSSFPASVQRKCQNSRVIIDPWLPPPQRCDFRFLR